MSPASRVRKKKKDKFPWGLIAIAVVLVVAASVLFKVFGPNTGTFTEGEYLYIRTGSSYEQVKQTLQAGGFIRNIGTFDLLAKQADYPAHVHPGKYKMHRGMSNYTIVKLLHSGKQTPVKLVVNKLRTQQDLVRLLGNNLEADSAVLWQMFRDPVYLAQFGLDTNTVMCAVIPDTYDFFWNTSADKAFRKIERNYARFWSDSSRQSAARDRGLTPAEVITIASIVEEESNKNDEKPNIASVYINRLQKGLRLQADPTIKFAIGDFTIRRITGAMLNTVSPYNTYRNAGLPPGPICTPSLASINAVLNAPKTDYIYFCAREDFSGYHRFAANFEEHMKNAHLYQQALNARGIH